VSYVGAHDSYAVSSTNVAANQDYDVTQQLTDGIRLLQVQCLSQSDGIHVCHSSCLLFDGGLLQTYLGKVVTWLNSNPNEVVSILMVNIDDLPASSYASVFVAAGLDKFAYSPPTPTMEATAWPSLGDMIDNGTRVVAFLDNGADATQATYLIDEFSNVWETAYDVTDPSFDCNVNRTAPATGKMYLINHFLDTVTNFLGAANSLVPDKAELLTTNAVSGAGSLGAQADECAAQWGAWPNFLLVDFYDWGNGSVFEVAATLNDVTYDPTTTIHPPANTSTSTSSTSTSLGYHTVSHSSLTIILGFLATFVALRM